MSCPLQPEGNWAGHCPNILDLLIAYWQIPFKFFLHGFSLSAHKIVFSMPLGRGGVMAIRMKYRHIIPTRMNKQCYYSQRHQYYAQIVRRYVTPFWQSPFYDSLEAAVNAPPLTQPPPS